jgi:hypothetical protein
VVDKGTDMTLQETAYPSRRLAIDPVSRGA